MKHIEIRTPTLVYSFDITTKFTFIQGNSGIGKTAFNSLQSNPQASIVSHSTFDVFPIHEPSFGIDKYIQCMSPGTICLVDEDTKYLTSNIFQDAAYASDCYFIISSRTPLARIPYSVGSIKTIETKNSVSTLKDFFSQEKIIRHLE